MVIAILAHGGGQVLLPHAESMVGDEGDAIVEFMDGDGRVLAAFRRSDLAFYTYDLEQANDWLRETGIVRRNH